MLPPRPLQLEYIEGEIWANIWQTDCIARICPDSGKVKGWLLLHGLSKLAASGEVSGEAMDVLNGEQTPENLSPLNPKAVEAYVRRVP